MPAPSTIVYLVDAGGDEFPIRLWGIYDPDKRAAVILEAMAELEGYVDRGEMNPTYPISVEAKIEQV